MSASASEDRQATGLKLFLAGCVLAILCLVLFYGCEGGVPTRPVSGTVYGPNGQPLKGIDVVFHPDPESGTVGPSSVARTDESGRYELRVHGGDMGAMIGKHRVVLSDPIPEEAAQSGGGPPPRHRIHPDYSRANKTPLLVEVSEGEGDQVIDLTADRR